MKSTNRRKTSNATAWLERIEPMFAALSLEERRAIADFSFLWAYFEGTVLGTNASDAAITESAEKLRRDGVLTLAPFSEAISYFRNRYFQKGQLTWNFNDLHFRSASQRQRAEDFVTGHANDEVHILSGLLIIIFRLRNNLFHGIKWADGIRGQLDNFEHANMVLMKTMELHRGGHYPSADTASV